MKLSAKARGGLVNSQFALPGTRRFPVNDRPHAINAKARASQMVKAGKLSPSTASVIDAKANRVLRK